MHAPPRRLLDFPEPGLHAVAPALPVDQQLADPRFAADEGEAEDVEGLRLADPAPGLSARRRGRVLALRLGGPNVCKREF
jgi:hypothetical protein